MIPVKIGILDDAGNDIPLQLEGEDSPDGTSRLLILDEAVQSWTFRNVSTKPLLSIGRGFSAPVIFNTEYTREQLAFLARHDSDLFNRADAFEKLTLQMVDQFITDLSRRGAQNAMPSESYLFAFEDILNDDSLSPAYRAKVLELSLIHI